MASEPSTFDKIKLVYVAVGTIVVGVVFVIGPGGLREEIPVHVPLGLGFVGLGVLMLLALVSVRVKSLFVGVVTGLFSAGGLFTAFYGDLNILHAGVIGVVSALAFPYAIVCLMSVFTGKDPT
jgi:hypothetical protein